MEEENSVMITKHRLHGGRPTLGHLGIVAGTGIAGFLATSGDAVSEITAYGDSLIALPTTGIIGLAIVAVACVVAGAFIILRRG
jgi:hypothetical protein